MELSIIIPVYNQERFTQQILDDIPNKIKSDYEIIIIDNGSDQATKELLRYYPVTKVTFQENQYVTKAWNIGACVARGEFLLICNNDITFQEGLDQELIKHYDGKIQSPLLTNVGDKPLIYPNNINGTCFLVKRDNWVDIPESIRIWYNDNWLFNYHGNNWVHTTEVLHYGSKTVNSINHNPITSEDKVAFMAICKENGWSKYLKDNF